jgi:hypothetical protein
MLSDLRISLSHHATALVTVRPRLKMPIDIASLRGTRGAELIMLVSAEKLPPASRQHQQLR